MQGQIREVLSMIRLFLRIVCTTPEGIESVLQCTKLLRAMSQRAYRSKNEIGSTGKNSHLRKTSMVSGSTESAKVTADAAKPNLRGTGAFEAMTVCTASVYVAVSSCSLLSCFFRGGSSLPKFFLRITWLRITFRSSGPGFSVPVAITNCSPIHH